MKPRTEQGFDLPQALQLRFLVIPPGHEHRREDASQLLPVRSLLTVASRNFTAPHQQLMPPRLTLCLPLYLHPAANCANIALHPSSGSDRLTPHLLLPNGTTFQLRCRKAAPA